MRIHNLSSLGQFRPNPMLFPALLGVAILTGVSAFAQTTPSHPVLAGDRVVARVSPSVVQILVGQGAGRLAGTASGLVVRSDGIILTTYHVVKDAQELQVRLHSGEVYDQVELLGFDERRDVAALRIPARGLTALSWSGSDEAKVGDPVYVISNPGSLPWTASNGILSGARLADEIPGAGSGYLLLQFTAPVSPGSSGGALVDTRGRVLGIVVASRTGQNLNFAVPVESVIGLADRADNYSFAPGNRLRAPTEKGPATADRVGNADPERLLRLARTVFIHSATGLFKAETLDRALVRQKGLARLDLKLVKNSRLADLIILVDRPVFTYDFTFEVVDRETTIVLTNGKVVAFSGRLAAPKIAKKLVKQLDALRSPSSTEAKEVRRREPRR